MFAQMKNIFARKTISLYLCLLLGALSCDKDPVFPAIVDIPLTFQIEMDELLQAGSRPFLFNLKSVEELDCTNYAIDHVLYQESNLIHLTLKDWDLIEPCEPGYGIATEVLNLGILQPGEFQIVITLQEVVRNEGMLIVSPEHYSIRMETSYGLLFKPNDLFRIPNETIWGGVYPQSDSLSALADDFLSELDAMVESETFTPGVYGPFEIQADQSIEMDDLPEGGDGHNFVYKYQGSRAELIDLVSNYRTLGGDDLHIYLFDVEGYEY